MEIPKGQHSPEFWELMKNRVIVGYHKYGPVCERHHEYDFLENVRERMRQYEKTGNTEFLVDAANFLMFEFMYPSHPDGHFRATDSHESPGVVYAGSSRPVKQR